MIAPMSNLAKPLAALIVVLALPVAATAAPTWKSPGWYQVADTIVGPFVWAGPYDSRESCEQVLPANEEDADYSCEYLDHQPDWDD